MRRGHKPAFEPPGQTIDAALAALDAEELRELAREMLYELDDRAHRRVMNAIISRAARGGSGWTPAVPSNADVTEAVAFADAARRVGYADPGSIDERLRRGTAAFLRMDYPAAHRIFGALLRPLAEAEIDVGQHEMLDEVLGVDANECAVQYVVSAYMTADATRRAEAVRTAIEDVRGAGSFFMPLRDMERAAIEPLPGLDQFLVQWRSIVAQEAAAERRSTWDTEADRWLREVVQRTEGAGGLAKLARTTRRPDDVRAWCESLAGARDWKAALAAFEEAVELVADNNNARGEFFDGAALAAQELGYTDLSPWLERAWRGAPSLVRLRRWLGSARGKQVTRKRAAEALQACPEPAHRQRAFLHVLQGEFDAAASLLAAAPGLGWSSGEHPGPLLFPLFVALFRGSGGSHSITHSAPGTDIDELELLALQRDGPRLATPDAGAVVRQAGIARIPKGRVRRAVLAAMREAAEKRVTGVTGEKRRRHYSHAASLVAACVACDRSSETARWTAALRDAHRRFPALRAELDRHLHSS